MLYHERPNEIVFGYRGTHSKKALLDSLEEDNVKEDLGIKGIGEEIDLDHDMRSGVQTFHFQPGSS